MQISGPSDGPEGDLTIKDGRRALAEHRQRQAETIEAINAWQHKHGSKTRRRKNWTQERPANFQI
jgi:hypothetical protein